MAFEIAVEEALSLEFSTEIVEVDEEIFCHICQQSKQKLCKKKQLASPPSLLLVQFLRFDQATGAKKPELKSIYFKDCDEFAMRYPLTSKKWKQT